MYAQVALREVAAAAPHLGDLAPSSSAQDDARSDSVAVGDGADRANRNPVIPVAPIVPQQGGRIVLIIDDDVQIAVVVEIAERNPASGAAQLEPGTGDRSDVFEDGVAGVVVKQIPLAIG